LHLNPVARIGEQPASSFINPGAEGSLLDEISWELLGIAAWGSTLGEFK
jgi:hypothetical protein